MISLVDLTCYIGAVVLIKYIVSLLSFIYASTIRAPVNLKKYGKWAVVTGSTDGIGKAYAHELAKKGLNIFLISRSQEKLATEAKEIESKYKVETKYSAFDFNGADDQKYEQLYKQHLESLDIGVLVNNVGISYEYPMYLTELPFDRVNALISMNVKSMVMMTKYVVNKMVENKRGAIINLSSISAKSSIPFLSVYSGTKSFVEKFSTSLNGELANRGVFVQCLAPGIVVSNMSKVRKPSLFVPLPSQYARAAVSTIGHESNTAGYWAHKIQTFLITSIPSILADKLMYDMHAAQRKRALAKYNKSQ